MQEHSRWEAEIIKDDLTNDYIENARRFNVNRRGTATSLGRFLNKIVPNLQQKQKMANIECLSRDGFTYSEKKRKWHYLFPTLEQCREYWEEQYGEESWPQYEELPVEDDTPRGDRS